MITILDYGAGNLTSVQLAFGRLGAETLLCPNAAMAPAEGPLVFPGVGSAESGMSAVKARGFDQLLKDAVAAGRPVLGICLGMQLLFDHSDEDGGVDGLGLLGGNVQRFSFPDHPELKVPEMGWNAVDFREAEHPLWQGIPSGTPFYFVHSYYCNASDDGVICGTTEYGGLHFTSAAGCGSLFATQFHPERSGEAGMQLLKNFLSWEGC